ncbi:MAG TPA: hypothetical protein VGZ71_12520 [Puia sp.]|jgi:hypothetical protein|nr:hypothetical protein [Puia sp.]
MSSRLEQFIRDHREEFDSDEPAKKVWDNIKNKLDPEKDKEGKVIRFNFKRWSAAAAVIIFIAGALWYATRSGTADPVKSSVSEIQKPSSAEPKSTEPKQVLPDLSSDKGAAQPESLAKNQKVNPEAEEEAGYREEMYHYAKLVEIKHKELRKIEKDEPLLYQKFAGDVNQLDSVYHTLQKQLPKNPNHEQLLEAMIQNLQLQMKLLNQQLDIIKQINHSKKSAYENAYKSA